MAAGSVFRLASHVPLDGATEVGVTFRPKITFSEPVKVATLQGENYFAAAGGRRLAATIVPANDGSFASLFFNEAMPGGARVRVTIEGSSIVAAASGALLDADVDGLPGGVRTFDFTTVSRVALAGTSLSGIVVDPGPDLAPHTADDVQPGPDGVLHTRDDVFLLPIAGVRVFLLGLEATMVTTGEDGRFHFDQVPVGNVKVVVDGQTATRAAAGMYFPEMVMDAQMIPGVENFAMMGMPEVYLPRLARVILEPVDVTTGTVITTKPEGAAGLSDEQRQRLMIEVPANSLIAADGTRLESGMVGISTVPPELVRDMLPPECCNTRSTSRCKRPASRRSRRRRR